MPHRGRVDLGELRLQIGAQSNPGPPSRSDTKYCESANPPTDAATRRAEDDDHGPRRVFFVIGWPRSRSLIFPAPEMRSETSAPATVASAPINAAVSGSERSENPWADDTRSGPGENGAVRAP